MYKGNPGWTFAEWINFLNQERMKMANELGDLKAVVAKLQNDVPALVSKANDLAQVPAVTAQLVALDQALAPAPLPQMRAMPKSLSLEGIETVAAQVWASPVVQAAIQAAIKQIIAELQA